MTYRTTASFALALLASPLLVLVACSDDKTDNTPTNTTAGTGAIAGAPTKPQAGAPTNPAGGAVSAAGSSATGGAVVVAGASSVAGSVGVAGSPAASGAPAVAGSPATAGASSVGGSSGLGGSPAASGAPSVAGAPAAAGVSALAGAGGAGTIGGTSSVAGSSSVAGAGTVAGSSGVAGAGPTGVCTETTKFSGGEVTANRTLTAACSPYVIADDISVDGNATLTIEPGVTLRFQKDVSVHVGYNNSAKLVAVGTAAAPIVFTSAAAAPGAGDWSGITLWSGTMNGTNIAYTKVDYCGSNNGACIEGVGVKPGRVTLDHVTVSHVGAGANGVQEDNEANFVISSCTFSDIPSTPRQQYAISLPPESFSGIDSTNAFNGNAMVEVTAGTVSVSATWKNIGTPVAVTDYLYVDGTPAPVLTIAAGSTFKFADDTEIIVGYSDGGHLRAEGTATAPVTFTSLDSTPAAGSWTGISVWDKATLNYAVVSYAGASDGNVIAESDTAVVDVQNSTLSNSLHYGIYVGCDSTATVTNVGNTFTANASGNVGPGPTGTACP